MLDKLKKWYDLLGREGINSKAIVRNEIKELIRIYESGNETHSGNEETTRGDGEKRK